MANLASAGVNLATSILSKSGLGGVAVSTAVKAAGKTGKAVVDYVKENKDKIKDTVSNVVEDVLDTDTKNPISKLDNVAEDLGVDSSKVNQVIKDVVAFDNPVTKANNLASDFGASQESITKANNVAKDVLALDDPVTKFNNVTEDLGYDPETVKSKAVDAVQATINDPTVPMKSIIKGVKSYVQTKEQNRMLYEQQQQQQNVVDEINNADKKEEKSTSFVDGPQNGDNEKETAQMPKNDAVFYTELVDTTSDKAVRNAANEGFAEGYINANRLRSTASMVGTAKTALLNNETVKKIVSSAKKRVNVDSIVNKGVDIVKTATAQVERDSTALE